MRKSKYTKELLEPIVKESKSIAEVIVKLGLKPAGGTYRMMNHRFRLLNLDISHFTGKAWCRGLTVDTDSRVCRITERNSYSDEEVFSFNSPIIGGPKITKRLLKLGWKYKCKICDLDKWLNQPITLHLDHINGVNNDNRFENLRFLCPNCHQQTDTWGNKQNMAG